MSTTLGLVLQRATLLNYFFMLWTENVPGLRGAFVQTTKPLNKYELCLSEMSVQNLEEVLIVPQVH